MSLLRKFQNLNNFIYNENYYKLIFGKTKIGYIHREIAKYLILNVKGIYLLEQNFNSKELTFIYIGISLAWYVFFEILNKKILALK